MGTLEELRAYQADWMKFAELQLDVINAFGQMRNAACPEDGVLDMKTLELVAVAVCVARKCVPCMLSHVEVAVKAGVTREELSAALNMAILLCGGPGWAYSAMALKAFDEITAELAEEAE